MSNSLHIKAYFGSRKHVFYLFVLFIYVLKFLMDVGVATDVIGHVIYEFTDGVALVCVKMVEVSHSSNSS
jgi:hypothetical protein